MAKLKESLGGPNRALWERLQIQADDIAKKRPPRYEPAGGEQLYQRGVGDYLATVSMAWLISNDPKYLKAAIAIATASCEFPTWGIDTQTHQPMSFGLSTGHQLSGLAMLYDYAHDVLPAGTKALIRNTLFKHGGSVFAAYKQQVHPFLQNHTWINSDGLMCAGFVTFDDENPDAANWIAMARNILSHSTELLSPDGDSQEGPGYWSYGVEHLIRLIEISQESTGVDYFKGPFWQKTADFPLYMTTARDSWLEQKCWVNFADCPRYF